MGSLRRALVVTVAVATVLVVAVALVALPVVARAARTTSRHAPVGHTNDHRPPAGRELASNPGGAAGPSPAFACNLNLSTDAYTGAFGTASAIGWEGNHQGVVTCLGGTFFVQEGINRDYGFGIYAGGPTSWVDAEGYLPAQITTFGHLGTLVTVTEFADRVTLGGDAFVAVYCRVKVANPTAAPVDADPEPSLGLIAIRSAPDVVGSHSVAVHDYVVAVDRFGGPYPWPSDRALAAAGGFDAHYSHMRSFWIRQLRGIATITVPDVGLENAYRSGFVYTQIARSGSDLDTGVNGYESEFSHDVIGILNNLFQQGYFADAHALLTEARNVVGAQGQYVDGIWTYAVPWATYLLKTGDIGFVRANFAPAGPPNPSSPSIEETAHQIAADRTGPSGIMEATDDIDTEGYWTVDDYDALLGLAAYRFVAAAVGDRGEAAWAKDQYESLLSSTDRTLESTIQTYGLAYLPCAILQPDTADRCANPEDANWTSPFGFGTWAWEGYLLGATPTGPGASLIDATYAYGFSRLRGLLPPDTTGGFPDVYYYSSAYDAAQGAAGLASRHHRDQGILDYRFMIDNTQSGPFSFWESSTGPSPSSPWVGNHPAAGQGSSPHAWGIAGANKVLLDSLVAQRSDGSLIVGRGIPPGWLGSGRTIAVRNFPTVDGQRVGITITARGRMVSLEVHGRPAGPVLFELPAFAGDISSAPGAEIDRSAGTVTIGPGAGEVTVELRHLPVS